MGLAAAVLTCTLLLAACSGIGPATVARDRFDYTTAVGESWKSQMLLNLVKIRYGDTPVFLDVASIINQYALETTLTAAGSINNVSGVVPGVPDSSVSLGGQGRWTDRPTITYSPLVGERFARSLMTPIPPPSLMSLIQAGYPIDLVFRLAVHVVNGIHNRYGGGARVRAADPEFHELLERLRRVQTAGVIGMRVRKVERDEAILMSFRKRIDPAVEADVVAARKLLGIDPSATEVRIVYGSVAENDKEIAILSRSIFEILVDLASYIAVPETHVAERRVGESPEQEVGPSGPIPPLMRIVSGVARPTDAFIAVPYRDHWYWIDDRDIPSKRLFTFLMFIFTLVETGGKEGAPIVTIPAG
jgi:hypothetical protein